MSSKLEETLSILIPVYNEEENLSLLCDKLAAALKKTGKAYEIIFIDDGSSDGTFEMLLDLRNENPNIKVISFSRNFGQTAALTAGIDFSKGDILIPMDGDLQNDPEDILPLLQKIDEGYDVVSGWRKGRKDPFLTRRLPSIIANKIISLIGGVHLHDYGCTLKAYRRDILKNIKLYGEMHRFIPIYAQWIGARVSEIPVRHFPREVRVIKIWNGQGLQSYFRPHGGQVPFVLFSETHIRFWRNGTFNDLRRLLIRRVRRISQTV